MSVSILWDVTPSGLAAGTLVRTAFKLRRCAPTLYPVQRPRHCRLTARKAWVFLPASNYWLQKASRFIIPYGAYSLHGTNNGPWWTLDTEAGWTLKWFELKDVGYNPKIKQLTWFCSTKVINVKLFFCSWDCNHPVKLLCAKYLLPLMSFDSKEEKQVKDSSITRLYRLLPAARCRCLSDFSDPTLWGLDTGLVRDLVTRTHRVNTSLQVQWGTAAMATYCATG
jgi:hypothetical protein